MEMAEVQILSRRTVRPSKSRPTTTIHLTPWDLQFLTIDYPQKGILFHKPSSSQQGEGEGEEGDGDGANSIVSRLFSSLSLALDHFFPLAGRLAVTDHNTSPPSISISLSCNDLGAEFIHASAPDVTVADILTPLYVPRVVWSFFPFNGFRGTEGFSHPVFAAQVTELADGVFIGCSFNHVVADGTMFWNFFNSWSEICRTGCGDEISNPPETKRWFLDSCPVPIPLPFRRIEDFVPEARQRPAVMECAFHFSKESIRMLKAKANAEMGTTAISSLQSLLGLLWRSVTRARRLESHEETIYWFAVGCRSRLKEVQQHYMGNAVTLGEAKATAGELLDRGNGYSSWLINQAVASYSEEALKNRLESWVKYPPIGVLVKIKATDLLTGSSPRFNVYGNDFGWGKPVAVRSGGSLKVDGKATIYEGPELGSMALEVCLSAKSLSALLEDVEFMEAVSTKS
ncbi:uncharacterized acetyltransferase At3g50280-like [Typha latifolia]|uniref:uncharacterized acetyltransferase At3g50280-like n=1 Tax=Typha latifolia TaxID=4733 RepID=UPI003C2FFEB0